MLPSLRAAPACVRREARVAVRRGRDMRHVQPVGDRQSLAVYLAAADDRDLPRATFATGNYPSDVQIADINGDSKPDLIVVDETDAALGVLTGNGDGSFAPLRTFPVGSLPKSLAAADISADGRPDLVMLDHKGYLSLFEQAKEPGPDGLPRVKPGRRVFRSEPVSAFDSRHRPRNAVAGLLRLNDGTAGASGRRSAPRARRARRPPAARARSAPRSTTGRTAGG